MNHIINICENKSRNFRNIILRLTSFDLAIVKRAKVPKPRHRHDTNVDSGIRTSHALTFHSRGSDGVRRPHASFDAVKMR